MRRDLIALNNESKVWIYQSDVHINDDYEEKIKNYIYDFTMNWASHGKELECYGNLFHHRFLVLVADDSQHVSGCSIDSSVHFVKQLENSFGIDFFNRLNYAYVKDDEFHYINNADFKNAYNDGIIDDQTLMVNNLVKTKSEFLERWILPLDESWYKKLLP